MVNSNLHFCCLGLVTIGTVFLWHGWPTLSLGRLLWSIGVWPEERWGKLLHKVPQCYRELITCVSRTLHVEFCQHKVTIISCTKMHYALTYNTMCVTQHYTMWHVSQCSSSNLNNPSGGCVFVPEWQAYRCRSLQHHMFIIESMDADTETRRLSPLALDGGNTGNGDYTDLLNGPMDHGVAIASPRKWVNVIA